MSKITIFRGKNPEVRLFTSEVQSAIRDQLHRVGIRFEQWPTAPHIGPHSSHEAILVAYDEPIQRLVSEVGYQSWDVVALNSDHPDKAVLRKKFLSEHTHNEDEVRFF
ncbi:MAG TPA: hypothetical protein PLD88_11820, partial [Candidatus Berkiella sp.]|nr:hypothetical protein [Candidatus Berkiella sp.]